MTTERNNSFSIKGKLYLKKDTQQVNDKFKKREFILEVSEENNGQVFTELIPFEFIQDRVDKLDYVGVGDQVEVDFSLSGREWKPKDSDEVKYFNSNKAWYIKSLQVRNEPVEANTSSTVDSLADDVNDGLPF